jgi:hypothetical protein
MMTSIPKANICLLTLCMVLTYNTIWADCSGNGIQIWPSAETIVPDQVFMFQGYFMDQSLAQQLDATYPIWLVSGAERIRLEVLEVCEGEFYLTQAILKPVQRLQSGKTYQLIVEHLDDPKRIQVWNAKHKKYMAPAWTVAGVSALTKPRWTSAPVEVDRFFIGYGCGPSKGVVFKIPTDAVTALRVRVSVKGLSQESWTHYYLEVEEGNVTIGHGMCAGAFRLDRDERLEAKFALVDAAGATVPYGGPPVSFAPPRANNSRN